MDVRAQQQAVGHDIGVLAKVGTYVRRLERVGRGRRKLTLSLRPEQGELFTDAFASWPW